MLTTIVNSLKTFVPKTVKRGLRPVFVRWGFIPDAPDQDAGESHEQDELAFQRGWARLYQRPEVKEAVHEYWKRFRMVDQLRAIGGRPEARILDVGCGVSTGSIYFSGTRVICDPLLVEYAKLCPYEPSLKKLAAAGEALPFREASFDLVICTNALDHTHSPSRAIGEIHRVLKVGGCFYLTVSVFKTRVVRDAAHPNSFVYDDLLDLLSIFSHRVLDRHIWLGLRNYVAAAVYGKYEFARNPRLLRTILENTYEEEVVILAERTS